MASRDISLTEQQKAEIKIGDRSYADLSPTEKQFLYLAANIIVGWLLQEAVKRNEPGQPLKLLGSGKEE